VILAHLLQFNSVDNCAHNNSSVVYHLAALSMQRIYIVSKICFIHSVIDLKQSIQQNVQKDDYTLYSHQLA
jgi:hypothetical protein